MRLCLKKQNKNKTNPQNKMKIPKSIIGLLSQNHGMGPTNLFCLCDSGVCWSLRASSQGSQCPPFNGLSQNLELSL